ncbi:MAG: alpha/beta hydrolase, partial [Candidatus Zixiibacteriota bacterium]
ATITYIRLVKCPVLIIHSMDDELVPYDHGRRLFEAAGQPKEFLEISGDHNRAFMDSSGKYSTEINSFLGRYLGD